MSSERRRGLDQPTLPRRRVPRPDVDAETFGRASERIARTFGTATYLMVQTVFVIVWISYNVVVVTSDQFDPYPFILLNLAFSTQAAYAAPLILLAQNRQADRDRVQYEQDRTRDERSVADMQFLAREVADIRIGLGDLATRDFVRSELRDLLDELLVEHRDSPEPRRAP
ncbi:MAG TPA: DUF1003 domain-containing protein [Actinomycetes bacterium]